MLYSPIEIPQETTAISRVIDGRQAYLSNCSESTALQWYSWQLLMCSLLSKRKRQIQPVLSLYANLFSFPVNNRDLLRPRCLYEGVSIRIISYSFYFMFSPVCMETYGTFFKIVVIAKIVEKFETFELLPSPATRWERVVWFTICLLWAITLLGECPQRITRGEVLKGARRSEGSILIRGPISI